MPKSTDRPEGRSQNLSSAPGDMVSLDRKTCHELGQLVGKSLDQLQIVRQSEVLLSSLEHHLSKLADEVGDKDLEIARSLLLLKYWLDCVPEFQTDITEWLQTAVQTLQVVLAASELGRGKNE
jgi:hypothetical protein